MKLQITALLILLSTTAFAQDSTKTKEPEKKKWSIELKQKQIETISAIDNQMAQIQAQFESLRMARETYIRSIIEDRDIDVNSIIDFIYKDGKMSFVELKPR